MARYCPNCGAGTIDTDLFCPACAHPLTISPQIPSLRAPPGERPVQQQASGGTYCPNCGAENAGGDKYCHVIASSSSRVLPVYRHPRPFLAQKP